jgi:hypothetical protein
MNMRLLRLTPRPATPAGRNNKNNTNMNETSVEQSTEEPASKGVDAAASGSGLVGKIGSFMGGDGRVCIAEVKAEDVDCPWESAMLEVLYEKWPTNSKAVGFIPRTAFHPLPVQNTEMSR